MEDNRSRSSAIPRLSRLPILSHHSLRPSTSLESFSVSAALRPPPGLRATASRDQLAPTKHPGVSRSAMVPLSPLQSVPTPQDPASPSTPCAPVRRRETVPTQEPDQLQSLVSLDVSESLEPTLAHSHSHRPSLSQRTIKTLSQVHSSPAVRKRPSTSAFFPESFGCGSVRPSSSAGSAGSRPGSSYTPDGFKGHNGLDPSSFIGHTGLAGLHRPPLSTIEGTPESPLAKNAPERKTLPKSSAANTNKSANLPDGSALRTQPSSSKLRGAATAIGPRTSTPVRKQVSSEPPSASQEKMSLALCRGKLPTQPPSLRRKQSSTLPDRQGNDSGTRNGESSPPQAITPSLPRTRRPLTVQKQSSTNSTPPPGPVAEVFVSTSRKSSAALREHIARLKAAKRTAADEYLKPCLDDDLAAAAAASEGERDVPPYSGVAATPDLVFVTGPLLSQPETRPDTPRKQVIHCIEPPLSQDPFEMSSNRCLEPSVLSRRIANARTSGRLNIAALELKEIPREVFALHDQQPVHELAASWAETVDLAHFVAANNELGGIDDAAFPDLDPESAALENVSCMFGGLQVMDLHGNLLKSIPLGFRRLNLLTSLNLSHNQLCNASLVVISQILTLRDLKLGDNLLQGPLDPSLWNLVKLEILDLHGNRISMLPDGIANVTCLRILNVSENQLETLPFSELARLPLAELLARKNLLASVLIQDGVEALPDLRTLDVSCNQITHLVRCDRSIRLPSLYQLTLSMNRLEALPDVSSWTSLTIVAADDNKISLLPSGFSRLTGLRQADFANNSLSIIPPEMVQLESLVLLRITGNPLHDKKFASLTTEELKDALALRLDPPPPYEEGTLSSEDDRASEKQFDAVEDDSRSDIDEYFVTPPTSAVASPSRAPMRANSGQSGWPVKPGGVLDCSNRQAATLNPMLCARLAEEHRIRQVMLHHNHLTTIPTSLAHFTTTLVSLSLAHGKIGGDSYLSAPLELPHLNELNLANNQIGSLQPLLSFLVAPTLDKLDISVNRVTALPPPGLRAVFPQLTIFLVADNKLTDLDPDALRGLRVVDASNNDIDRLDPQLGLLAGRGGLERLDVKGNRFRVPRWDVLESGTEATLLWLRGRVSAAEQDAWQSGEADT